MILIGKAIDSLGDAFCDRSNIGFVVRIRRDDCQLFLLFWSHQSCQLLYARTCRRKGVLRIERQSYLLDVDQIVNRIILDRFVPLTLEAEHPNLADAILDALRLLAGFSGRVAGDTFLGFPGQGAEHALLVGTRTNALSVSAASLLVEKNCAVSLSFVDCLARTAAEAPRIRTVVAYPGKVEHPGLMRYLDELPRLPLQRNRASRRPIYRHVFYTKFLQGI